MDCKTACGKCCAPIIMDKDFVEEHKDKYQREIKQIFPTLNNEIIPLTYDLKCVFQTEDGKCAVYNDRPEVCREYSCNGKPPEKPICCMQRTKVNYKDKNTTVRIGVYMEYCDLDEGEDENWWFDRVNKWYGEEK